MNKVLTLLSTFTFIFYFNTTVAQNGTNMSAGARGFAMGNASTTFQDVNSLFSNQAGLAYMEKLGVTVGGERRFLLADLNNFIAGVAYPTKSGTFGLAINYFGFADYNEQKIGLAYARKLGDKVSIGAQLDYLSTRIPEYGNTSNFTFEIGVQSILMEQLILAAHIFSPIRQEVVAGEDIPTVFKLGVGYMPSEKLLVSGEVEKDIDYKTVFKVGIEYFLVDAFALRTGFSTEPIQNTFGFGFNLKNGLKIDVGAGYHYQLGVTPAASITYQMP